MDDHASAGGERELALRDRLPDYAAVFGIGLLGTSVVGVVIWLISDVSLASSVGYTMILYGMVFMLAGGATGGGYTNLGMGAVGSLFGGQRSDDAPGGSDPSSGRMDPSERLRRGLRPEANPRAFWQVVGGLAYLGVGLAIVIIGS
jgi:hypothetical protein